MDKKDLFVEELRGSAEHKDMMTKHLGFYKAKEVDRYASQMQERIHNMENVYQERFDDQRMSLLGVTRERDELAKRISQMEKEMVTPESWEAAITEQGMICVKAADYKEALDAAASFSEEKDRMIKERAQLEESNKKLTAQKNETEALQQQILDLQMQLQKQSEEISKAKTEYQVLSIKNQQGQDSIRQLREEIKAIHKENSVRLQKKEAQYRLIIERCQGVLTGHQKFLQQLQESFTSSSETIDELCESVLTAKDSDELDTEEHFFSRASDRPAIRIS